MFSINNGCNSSSTFILFMIKLATYLNHQKADWRKNTVLMIDNAPYHRSSKSMEAYTNLKLPIMFLGPYQFHLAPVEKLFSYIKARDLNPLRSKA